MARLGRLETMVGAMARDVSDLKTDVSDLKTAAWRVAEILTDHSERLDGLQRTMDERLDGLQRTMDERLGGLQRTMDERLGGVNERLDRLIAATLQGRTADTERFGDIERRLARLEERVGV